MTLPTHASRTYWTGRILRCAHCHAPVRHIGGACGEPTPEIEVSDG